MRKTINENNSIGQGKHTNSSNFLEDSHAKITTVIYHHKSFHIQKIIETNIPIEIKYNLQTLKLIYRLELRKKLRVKLKLKSKIEFCKIKIINKNKNKNKIKAKIIIRTEIKNSNKNEKHNGKNKNQNQVQNLNFRL